MDAITDFIFGIGVQVNEGILTLFAFFVIGLCIAWNNKQRFPIGVLAQFVYASWLVRVISSYAMFHHAMLEGMWGLAWVSAGLIGLRCGRAK